MLELYRYLYGSLHPAFSSELNTCPQACKCASNSECCQCCPPAATCGANGCGTVTSPSACCQGCGSCCQIRSSCTGVSQALPQSECDAWTDFASDPAYDAWATSEGGPTVKTDP
jgi:hypothetical protein